jgi:hypothetical protein
MDRDNKTWVHPNAISYESEGVKGRLHYFRHWQRLVFTLEHYTITRQVSSQDAEVRIYDDLEFNRAAEKLGRGAFDALSEAEQDAFRFHQLKYVQKAAEPEFTLIEGWAHIDEENRIRAFSVKNGRQDAAREDYDRKFRDAKISIRSHNEDHVGSLFLYTADLRKYGSHDDDPDEDFLIVNFHVEASRLLRIVEDLASTPVKPPLKIYAQALLFQDEVEASLSEPWHPHEYCFIHDESAPAILNWLRYPLIRKVAEPGEAADAVTDIDLDASPVRKLLGSETKRSRSAGDVAKQLRGIKRALWILAGAILLAALIAASP